MTHLLTLISDLIPRRLRCEYGCEFRTFYGPDRKAHYRTNHAGDRMDRCERTIR